MWKVKEENKHGGATLYIDVSVLFKSEDSVTLVRVENISPFVSEWVHKKQTVISLESMWFDVFLECVKHSKR